MKLLITHNVYSEVQVAT